MRMRASSSFCIFTETSRKEQRRRQSTDSILETSNILHLISAGRPALDLRPFVLHFVELAHPVEEVVHARQIGSDAHVVVFHGVLAAHRVKACGDKQRRQQSQEHVLGFVPR